MRIYTSQTIALVRPQIALFHWNFPGVGVMGKKKKFAKLYEKVIVISDNIVSSKIYFDINVVTLDFF